MGEALCETCLERGRERPATRHGLFGDLCEDCFSGKPFRREETTGGGASAASLSWKERNREKYLAARRRWYRENRESILAAKRAEYQEVKDG